MPADIVVPFPLDTAMRAQRLLFFSRVGLRACLLIAAIWVLTIVVWAITTVGLLAHIALMLAALATMLPPVAYFSSRRLLKKAFRSIPSGAYTYSIDEQGISWRSPIGFTQVNWAGFTRVYQFQSLWVLIIAEKQFVALPTDQLDGASRELILAKVKSIKGKLA